MMHNGSKLRESFQKIFLILLPLLFWELSCHIWCHCICNSQQCGGRRIVVTQIVNWEVSPFVFEDVDSSKSSSLSLSCSLSLSDNIVSINTISKPNNAIDGTLEKLYFLKFAYSTCFLDWWKLHSNVLLCLVNLQINNWATIHLILQVVLGHKSGDQVTKILLSDSYLIGNVRYHKPSHFFCVS